MRKLIIIKAIRCMLWYIYNTLLIYYLVLRLFPYLSFFSSLIIITIIIYYGFGNILKDSSLPTNEKKKERMLYMV